MTAIINPLLAPETDDVTITMEERALLTAHATGHAEGVLECSGATGRARALKVAERMGKGEARATFDKSVRMRVRALLAR